MEKKLLVLNKVKCLCCQKELISYHRHDYKECGCDNITSVDGGTSYLRYGAVDFSKVQCLAIYIDDDFEIVRKSFHWGTYGKDGKQPLRWIPICDLTTQHIEAICNLSLVENTRNIFLKELEFRNEKV